MQANVMRTNLVERWITNLIEIRMPLNRFVNEYQTNWVTQYHTNVIDVYATNQLTRTVTNQVLMDSFQTEHPFTPKIRLFKILLNKEHTPESIHYLCSSHKSGVTGCFS